MARLVLPLEVRAGNEADPMGVDESKIKPHPPIRQRDPVACRVAVPLFIPALRGQQGQAPGVEHGGARMLRGADRGVADPRHVARRTHQRAQLLGLGVVALIS